MRNYWRDAPVAQKLYVLVGLMAVLITTELITLLFAINTLSSVRAFVAGEGVWSKAQKDAIQHLNQYALFGDETFYDQYLLSLEVPAGDHIARMELLEEKPDLAKVRAGFRQGGNHESDIDRMINLLLSYNQIHFIKDAVQAWTKADGLLEEIKEVGAQVRADVLRQGGGSDQALESLKKIARLNSELTKEELRFSSSLGAGSRWLEKLITKILILVVLSVEGLGLLLTFRFSRNLTRSLRLLMQTTLRVRSGDFQAQAPVASRDELGQLAESINKMTAYLRSTISRRRLVAQKLKENKKLLLKANEELERRVDLRTREIKKAETQLRQITNALPSLVIHVDKHEKIKFANTSLFSLTGKEEEEILGQQLTDIIGLGNYEAIKPFLRRTRQNQSCQFECELNILGQNRSYSVSLVPDHREDLASGGYILLAADITKHKEIEFDLQTAKQNAEMANLAKSTFLANMSHEIRTPLASILGFSELMSKGEMTRPEHSEMLTVIRRNGELLSNIVNDILDLSRVESGKLICEKISVPLQEIIEDIEPMMKLRADEKGLNFGFVASEALPENIVTDPLRLRQILLNIIGNAIKFTDRGHVLVYMNCRKDLPNLSKLIFRVEDTGTGIGEGQQKNIFTPFVQADASTTRKYGGSGLGLALSKKLAIKLGGDVKLISSEPSLGSIFEISIDPGISKKILNHYPVKEANSIPEGLQKSQGRILVVDDSPDIRLLLQAFLHSISTDVDTASNGKECLDKVLADDYSLVIMDIQMPVLDGYQTIKELRRRNYMKPVVALTAHAMSDERKRCLDLGFTDHISKPISSGSFLKVVAKYSSQVSVSQKFQPPSAEI